MLRYCQHGIKMTYLVLGMQESWTFKFPTANKISDSSMPKIVDFSINYFEII